MVYSRLHQYKPALEYHEKALSIRKIVFQDQKTHPDIADSCSNIALVSYNQNDLKKALKYHKKALHIKEIVYGESHPETADSYAGLAFAFKDLGDCKQALDHSKKAIDIYKTFYGPTHPKTSGIACLHNLLAQVCQLLGN